MEAAASPADPSALVGRRAEASWEWDSRDVMLYALGVGASRDAESELELSTENSTGHQLRPIPSFAVLMAQTVTERLTAALDPTKVVHAEQELTIARPLPNAGRATVSAEVEAAYDKGSGALVAVRSTGVDAESGEELVVARSTVFVRDGGGFGGERGPSRAWQAPDRDPDLTLTSEVRRDQALLYRLNGDRNPLHSDPEFARRSGFERPILHGLATFGITSRLLFGACCDLDPERFAGIAARFSKPVLPGETLHVDAWVDAEEVLFRTRSGDGDVVLDRGTLTRRI
ncbi:MAG TPA: MaoC/PaaZ C-terminal domain-containing protein [Solirubrobacterales bacterium]|jgi:acyl dehydratase|nr:MaoC/PaaZ C-terminal domain-containing protein [Solirubrobacterales bacterium]